MKPINQMTARERAEELDQLNRVIEEYVEQLAHPSPPGTHKVRVQVTREGVNLIEWIDAADDWQPTPATVPPTHPRTASNPRHDTWKSMDRRTSYATGAEWHRCPNCEGLGLRRWYSDGQERCWDCGHHVIGPTEAERQASKAAKLKQQAINRQLMAQARADVRAMVERARGRAE